MPLESLVGRRRSADVVDHVEEVDDIAPWLVQSLPDDAGVELDHVALGRVDDRPRDDRAVGLGSHGGGDRQLARHEPGRRRRARRSARSRWPTGVLNGGLGPTRLDLRDQAGRHAEPARQLALADPRSFSLFAQARAEVTQLTCHVPLTAAPTSDRGRYHQMPGSLKPDLATTCPWTRRPSASRPASRRGAVDPGVSSPGPAMRTVSTLPVSIPVSDGVRRVVERRDSDPVGSQHDQVRLLARGERADLGVETVGLAPSTVAYSRTSTATGVFLGRRRSRAAGPIPNASG